LNHREVESNSNISTGSGSGSNNRSNYDNRKLIFVGALIVVSLAFIARLFYLQLVDTDYKAWADSNAFLKKSLYPARGMIYDRNGKLLVYNRPAYDLMLIMREVQPFDTLDFCRTVGLDKGSGCAALPRNQGSASQSQLFVLRSADLHEPAHARGIWRPGRETL
jgi:hypothetical protein